MQNGSVRTRRESMDVYEKYVENNPFYERLQELYGDDEWEPEHVECYNDDQYESEKAKQEYFDFLDEEEEARYYEIEEEELEKEDLNIEIKANSKYIKALKKRYDNRKNNVDENYTYMYEIYCALKYISYYARIQNLKSEYIDELIEAIENNIDIAESEEKVYSYNIDVDFHNLMKNHLEDIKLQVDFDEFNHIEIVNDEFIEEYFESKENKKKREK